MQEKRFQKNDGGFLCENCKREVSPLGYTSRNHCPFCLYSKHLDINPGDRESDCGGLMKPVSMETDGKKGYVLVFKCLECGAVKRNKCASDDDFESLLSVNKNR